MDHLPYPDKACNPPIEVPFLCGNILSSHELCRVDSGQYGKIPTLSEYLQWYHDGHEGQQDAPGPGASDNDRLATVQAFAYFGLLKEILGDAFVLEDFLVYPVSGGDIPDSGPCRKISLVRLGELLAQVWRQQQRSYAVFDHSHFISTWSYIKRLVGQCDAALGMAEFVLGPAASTSPTAVQNLSLALEILTWTLKSHLLKASPEFIYALKNGTPIKRVSYSGHVLLSRLQSAGWCPHRLSCFMRKLLSPPLLYYLGGFPQHGHDGCSETRCVAHNVDPNNYIMRHVDSSCQCHPVGPDLGHIRTIISSGGIPLLRLTRDAGNDGVRMNVVEASADTPYVAISHVWADGLGNPQENSVYSCQVRDLFEKLSILPPINYSPSALDHTATEPSLNYAKSWTLGKGPFGGGSPWNAFRRATGTRPRFRWLEAWRRPPAVNLWIDTLCIPCGDADAALRSQAIHKMALIYAAAEQVMVIDRTLSDLDYDTTSDLAIAIGLLKSPWMARAWTFQEACLARKLSFVLRHSFVSPTDWTRPQGTLPPDRCTTVEERTLKLECLQAFDDIPFAMTIAAGQGNIDILALALKYLFGPYLSFAQDRLGGWFGKRAAPPQQTVDNDQQMTWTRHATDFLRDLSREFAFADAVRGLPSQIAQRQFRLQLSHLSSIWNELTIRSTTKSEDLHGILAVLIGLSVREVLDLPVPDRMKAIVRCLGILPLPMFFGRYGAGVATIPGCDWIPLFPAGRLVWSELPMMEDYLRWTDNGDLRVTCGPLAHSRRHVFIPGPVEICRHFTLDCTNLSTTVVDREGTLRGLILPRVVAEDGSLHVFLLPAANFSGNATVTAPHGIILTMDWWDDCRGDGACFLLKDAFDAESASATVQYLCPIQFGAGLLEGESWDSGGPSLRPSLRYGCGITLLLKLENTDWPPPLTYFRPSGELLVSGSFLAVGAAIGSLVWDVSILAYLAIDLRSRGSGFRIWHLYPLAIMKAAQVFGTFLEFKTESLSTAINRDRYNAIAQTFDTEQVQGGEPGARFKKKLWSGSVLLIRACVGTMLVVGSYSIGRSFGKQLRRYGYAFLLEVVVRRAAEGLWHSWHLDSPSFWAPGLRSLQTASENKSEKINGDRYRLLQDETIARSIIKG